MASQYIHVATPSSKNAILESLVENVRACNARLPPGRDEMVFGACELKVEIPLLLNRDRQRPLFSPNTRFHQRTARPRGHGRQSILGRPGPLPPRRMPSARHMRFQSVLRTPSRLFAPRLPHSLRLTVQNPDSLPLLNRLTQLRILPDRDFTFDPINMRPVSLRTPLELITRLPQLCELDCPWMWERLPVAFTSKALRIISRVWAGPWRDDRTEFALAVRHTMPLLPSSLTKVRLWFWRPSSHGDEVDQAAQMPDLVGASSSSSSTNEFGGMDPVSLGLRDLGSRLEELDVRALITPNLFPSGGDGPSWSHMRHLNVEFHPCGPDGSWYFSGPRGEDPHATGFAITREEHYPPGLEDDDETHQWMSDEEEEY